MKKKLLIFSEYYLPGFKSGGGMRTIVNIVKALHDRYDFFIITNDHDGRSDTQRYTGIKINDWNQLDNCKVFYISNNNIKANYLIKIIESVDPDLIYSNSCFSSFNRQLLILNGLKKLKKPYVISPCGELSDGALEKSFLRKKIFLTLVGKINLNRNIVWKVTDFNERAEVERIGVNPEKIYIAPDLVDQTNKPTLGKNICSTKTKGEVNFVFLSRFCEKKNFKFFLENLVYIKGRVNVDIYAPIESEIYWKECEKLIAKLPDNITVVQKHPVVHSAVHETLKKYHYFVMPTYGENFGHVFIESLSAGCPLLISDRTPWRDLESQNIGWDIPLEKPEKWSETIQKCVDMDDLQHTKMCKDAEKYAYDWFEKNEFEKITVEMLETLLKN